MNMIGKAIKMTIGVITVVAGTLSINISTCAELEYSVALSTTSVITDIPYDAVPKKYGNTDGLIFCPPTDVIRAKAEIELQKKLENSYVGDFELTAYIATGSPCADGVYPQVGYTVACNDSRLWHKTIYIEGYGTFYVHDTGGMANNVIDVFVGSYGEAIQFGRRYGKVYILE